MSTTSAFDQHNTEQSPAKKKSRVGRFVLVGLGVTVVAVGAVATVALTASPIKSPGAVWSQWNGDLIVNVYSDAGAVPRGLVPAWADGAVTEVVSLTPGDGTGNAGTVLAMNAGNGASLPEQCISTDIYTQPWWIEQSWPDFTSSDLHECDGWTAYASGDHWYAWAPTTLR